ncbi:MAG: hypothetical protein ACYS22_20495, partial [Planctomycetota bacterium]
MGRGSLLAFTLFAVAALALLYGRTLAYPFVFDDHVVVRQNPATYDLGLAASGVAKAYQPGLSDAAVPGTLPIEVGYRPLRGLSYAADVKIYGLGDSPANLAPWGFRLTNLILHLIACLLVAGIGRLLFGRAAGLIAAVLFCVHPLATEAVTYVSGRKDVLCAGLYLGAVYAYLRMRASVTVSLARRSAYASLITFLFVLAFLAKEVAVTLPAALLLFDLALTGWRGPRRRALPLALLFALAGLFTAWIALGWAPAFFALAPVDPIAPWVLPRIATMVRVAWRYVALVFYPDVLSADYSFDAIAASEGLLTPWTGALGILMLVGLGVLLVRLWRRGYRQGVACALFFPVALLPVLQIVPHAEPIAERYLYLPMVGLILATAHAVVVAAQRAGRAGPWLVGALVVAVGLLGARTFTRNADWRAESALYQQAALAYPRCARANLAWAQTLRARGRAQQALDPLDRALEVLPETSWHSRRGALRATVLFERASVRMALGQPALALEDLDRLTALPGRPEPGAVSGADLPGVALNRAAALIELGRVEEALESYRTVLDLVGANEVRRSEVSGPDVPHDGPSGETAATAAAYEREATLMLAEVSYKLGRKEQAREWLAAALAREEPGHATARLAAAYVNLLVSEREYPTALVEIARLEQAG